MLGKIFGYFKNLEYSDITNIRTREHRIEVCKGCPKYRKHFTTLWIFKKKNTPQCGLCKCIIKDKVLFENEKCPLNKW